MIKGDKFVKDIGLTSLCKTRVWIRSSRLRKPKSKRLKDHENNHLYLLYRNIHLIPDLHQIYLSERTIRDSYLLGLAQA
jgi:hypothetical protein